MTKVDRRGRGGPPPIHARDAGPDEMEVVLRASHGVWGQGMSPDDYVAYNRALIESPWGRERSRFVVGSVGDGAIVAALKLYDLAGELHGRRVRIAGIGALFTLPDHRGRGFGAALLDAVLDGARSDGFALALLLSDIDPSWYGRRGFVELPAGEAACVPMLPATWPGEPEWVGRADPPRGCPGLRAGGPADIDELVRVHDRDASGAAFRLTRDRSAWTQIFLKTEAGRRLRGDGETLFWMIDDGAGTAAYAVVQEWSGVLRWLEHGARRGCERSVEGLFWAAIALARRRRLARLEGWTLPSGAEGRTLYPIARRARRRPLPMARALVTGVSLAGLRAETDCRIAELERF